MSSLTLIHEERKRMTRDLEKMVCSRNFSNFSKSVESVYSSASSRNSGSMYRRKPAGRQSSFIPAVGEVRQRVISARLHRVKSLQNQLGDAQNHIAELLNENRLLKSLHKRQDSALARYESSNAELPQLLRAHTEEIRAWESKCRKIQNQNKEMNARLKKKDGELLVLRDQNKYLIQLSANKNLEEREKLAGRVRFLEARLMEKDEEMRVLLRRLQLEAKNYKSQIHNEHLKCKELNQKLEKASSELLRVSGTNMLESKSQLQLPKSMMRISRIEAKSPKMVNGNGSNHSSATSLPELKRDSKRLNQLAPTAEESSEKSENIGRHIKNGMIDFKDIKYNPQKVENSDSDAEEAGEEEEVEEEEVEEEEDDENDNENVFEAKKSADSSVRSSNSSLQTSSTERLINHSSDTLLKDEPDKSDLDTIRNDTTNTNDTESTTKPPPDSKMEQLYNNLLNENSKYYTKLSSHTLNVRTQSSASTLSASRRASAKERKQSIDTQKKTKLLAALKAIDSNQSFEN